MKTLREKLISLRQFGFVPAVKALETLTGIDLIIDESSHKIDIDGECRVCLFDFSASIHSRYIKLYN